MKKFDIIGGNKLKEEDGFGNIDFSKYSGFHTLSKGKNQEAVQNILKEINIIPDSSFIKDLTPISTIVRKNIKDLDKNLLEILDTKEFLISFLYIMIGFGIGKNSKESKNSINTINSLTGTILQLLKNDDIKINSFLCAHRENKTIKKNSLVENINNNEFQRVQNLLYGILENIPKKPNYEISFHNMSGNKTGLEGVFPSISLEYFEKGEISSLLLKLDQHLEQLQKNSNSKVNVKDLDFFTRKVDIFLNEKYGNNWNNITYDKLKHLSEKGDIIANITINHTLKDISRIQEIYNDFNKKYNIEEQKLLIKENIKKSNEKYQNQIEEILENFINKKNIFAKALKETAFYYFWGKYTFENQGIGFGFDRDHDLFQTISFEKGFGNENAPLLYAKRTGKKSENNTSNISFRQFWHF